VRGADASAMSVSGGVDGLWGRLEDVS